MTTDSADRRTPGIPGLVAGGLVIVGILLWMLVDKSFLFIAGLGAFGPGILRELGWLRDQDEFQRGAARRAGYNAYLVGGLAAVVFVSFLEWQGTLPPGMIEWLLLVLALLWLSWLFSSLLAYWGARTTTARLLIAVGSFWGVFVLAHFFGEEARRASFGQNLAGALAGASFVGPFFVLAWTARRWPRVTGIALLVVAAAFGVVLRPRGALPAATQLLTATLLILPLLACGIALLREKDEEEREA